MEHKKGSKNAFDINARAREYGSYIGLKQNPGESDDAYRYRVAAKYRESGKVIEAHEVLEGRAFDDPKGSNVMAGILGALKQEITGKTYSPNDTRRQLEDDIAIGNILQAPRNDLQSTLSAIFGLFGSQSGMDFINSMHNSQTGRGKK